MPKAFTNLEKHFGGMGLACGRLQVEDRFRGWCEYLAQKMASRPTELRPFSPPRVLRADAQMEKGKIRNLGVSSSTVYAVDSGDLYGGVVTHLRYMSLHGEQVASFADDGKFG
ncbi:hypothetical protein Salat_1461500 [Sesamum alatum]|uniref:Uncharacterized protein n=1 Tax=Sesamum alatum TaxID=300844 RepID=A0AAE1YBH4_9LAMI|nr:hypothetical protein Salat_1461500 [Sesamum alatum]